MPQRLSRSAPQQSNSAGVVLFKVAFLCVILMLIMALICTLSPLAPQSSPVAGEEHARPCVILDAGHGGEDGGAVCADGTTEKELNLAIVLRMGEFLRLQGVQVIYTRTEDVSLNVENIPGQHKRYDLKNRLKIAQKYPEAIFVSIHMNKFAQPQYGGAQVFYSVNHPDSETLAAQMRQDICDTLQPENQRTIKAAGSSIYLLDRCKSPAVLVECGFLSNPDDAAMLCSTAGQMKMAAVLSQSILTYFSNKEPAA